MTKRIVINISLCFHDMSIPQMCRTNLFVYITALSHLTTLRIKPSLSDTIPENIYNAIANCTSVLSQPSGNCDLSSADGVHISSLAPFLLPLSYLSVFCRFASSLSSSATHLMITLPASSTMISLTWPQTAPLYPSSHMLSCWHPPGGGGWSLRCHALVAIRNPRLASSRRSSGDKSEKSRQCHDVEILKSEDPFISFCPICKRTQSALKS